MIDGEFLLIEKENVKNLHFPDIDVLLNEKEIKEREEAIQRAISLGNLEHHKVKIYFSDKSGKKMINTTIWAVTDHSIVLKQNSIIPKKRIFKLEL
ncbi:MAG: hypothetical protein HYU67_08420 [Flavobacteriia bacterium]|nr:hypothetical protein [Flavobacteriia bacterium]